ncbi:MAG: aldolase/citrate lyase family protein [Planctomycetota bacterium]|nr:aldolase/citrate lyase family protein [Planctomycetota bacterium]
MTDNFRSRLRNGETLLGTMVTLSTPSTAEILADVGFDWLFVDGEHGPLDTSDLLAILQTVSRRVACLVRVPVADEVSIKKVLDLGAAGVIAPQVNTAEHAANVVSWSRYSPVGTRGVGLARAHGYGLRFQEYVETANETVSVVVQAEHARAVDNIESIVKVEGIDAILLGPYDLAASLGKMGQVDDPKVVAAIKHVTQTCRAAGVPLGMFGVTAKALTPYLECGYTLIVGGVDTLMLGTSAKRMLSDLRANLTANSSDSTSSD